MSSLTAPQSMSKLDSSIIWCLPSSSCRSPVRPWPWRLPHRRARDVPPLTASDRHDTLEDVWMSQELNPVHFTSYPSFVDCALLHIAVSHQFSTAIWHYILLHQSHQEQHSPFPTHICQIRGHTHRLVTVKPSASIWKARNTIEDILHERPPWSGLAAAVQIPTSVMILHPTTQANQQIPISTVQCNTFQNCPRFKRKGNRDRHIGNRASDGYINGARPSNILSINVYQSYVVKQALSRLSSPLAATTQSAV